MSKKGLKTDELIDQLVQDDRLSDALTTRVSTNLSPIIEQLFDKIADSFLSKLEGMVENITKKYFASECESLNNKISALEATNKDLQQRLNEVEINSRSDSLIFHGITETPDESIMPGEHVSSQSTSHPKLTTVQPTVQKIMQFCAEHLHLKISEFDISTAFRIPGKGKFKTRPLVVHFTNKRIMNMVYSSKKLLREVSNSSGTRFYINENLTPLNARIFAKTRAIVREKKAHSTWTSGGRVLIRITASQDEKPKRIASLEDLDN